MDKDTLRKSDFKTGSLLIVFCLWFLSVTFLFMPFKETYGGVDNVWYVSPWIFPAIVLTLLLILSIILTINAAIENGMRDLIVSPDGQRSNFRLTGLGYTLVTGLAVVLTAGLWYLIVSIEDKIASSLEEAKWLSDPSKVQVFEWSDPIAVTSVSVVFLMLAATLYLLALSLFRHRAVSGGVSPGHKGASESTISLFIIATLFCMLIYVFVPRVDFFVSILLFLSVFTAVYHVADPRLTKVALGSFLGISVLTASVFATGLAARINAVVDYGTDFLILIATIALMLRIRFLLSGNAEAIARYRTSLLVSWLTPLILVPAFRFGLLVPLPHEGGVIEFMHVLRYTIQ